jgi:hypothetical protein
MMSLPASPPCFPRLTARPAHVAAEGVLAGLFLFHAGSNPGLLLV